MQLKVDGTPDKRFKPFPERFWSKVEKTSACWIWIGGHFPCGYGCFRLDGKVCVAHRVSYELVIGPIPDGLTIDHLCRNRTCVNPEHLEPVTMRENVLRGESCVAKGARQTHCKQGHPFSEDNTMISSTGQRVCRICRKAAWTKFNKKVQMRKRKTVMQ